MRNESDYIYYFSSEQKSEPKHAAVKCAPKHLKKHRHIRAIHLFALCYLLIAAMLMSTSGSFAKFTETSPTVTANNVSVASFNYDVKNLNVSEINKSDFNLNDTDIVVCAFEVSNADAEGNISDVALSCDVQLQLRANYDIELDDYYQVIEEDQKKIDACKSLNLYMKVKDSANNLASYEKSDISLPDGPKIAPASMVIPSHSDLNGAWNDKITFNAGDSDKKVCLIYVDTSKFDYSINTIFDFNGPMINQDNLKIFVNQVD